MSKATLLRLSVLTLLLLGCSRFRAGGKNTSTPSPAAGTPFPTTASAAPSPTTPSDAAPSPTPETQPITLVLWTSEDYAPTSETAGGVQLLEQIQAFQQTHDVQIEVILKKRSGSGGLLDFLSTASKAAPSVLPDLITLSNADLYRAAQAGLVQPLDAIISPALLADQFNFARRLTQVNGATLGVLYQADLTHLVYDASVVKEAPVTWQELYSTTVPLVFSPAPPTDGLNDALLVQYLALGGRLTDAAGKPILDADPLTQALTLFQQGRQERVIPRTVLDLTDATAAWAEFRIGEAGMALVPASLYLAERPGLSNVGFGPVPLPEPGFVAVGRGWALALVTQDPTRQTLAVALIEYLLSTENHAAWSQAAGRLPTRQTALEAWDSTDAYVPFIRDLLTQAQPAPNPDLVAVLAAPLTDALADVLAGRATPEEAAQEAVQAVGGAP